MMLAITERMGITLVDQMSVHISTPSGPIEIQSHLLLLRQDIYRIS
jgi:hypothetical protein